MTLSYQKPGLSMSKGASNDAGLVEDLQRDLRRLGYLRAGIDGQFGEGTQRALRRLQFDLMNNAGRSTAQDGDAPVRVVDYNRSRVVRVDGVLTEQLAGCIADLLGDDHFPKVPAADNPASENAKAVAALMAIKSPSVPIPFLLAIFAQESDTKHFCVPSVKNKDNFVVVGLDTNASDKDKITSRGYGIGQFTIFHHPPREDEVQDFILDVKGNVEKAVAELEDKFQHFVNGNTSGTKADDRMKERGAGPLCRCKHPQDDARFMRDCTACARNARKVNIVAGQTPFYEGSGHVYEPTGYHTVRQYSGVPARADLGCDWPYAVRRYNGSGVNSYHYQCKVLLRLLKV